MNTLKISKDIIGIINKYNLPSKRKIEEYKYYRYFELYNLFRYQHTLPGEILSVKNQKYGYRSIDADNNLLNHYTYPKFSFNPNIIKCIYCGISCSIDGYIRCSDIIWLNMKLIDIDVILILLIYLHVMNVWEMNFINIIQVILYVKLVKNIGFIK